MKNKGEKEPEGRRKRGRRSLCNKIKLKLLNHKTNQPIFFSLAGAMNSNYSNVSVCPVVFLIENEL